MKHQESFYIDGAWVTPQSETRLDVVDPSTERPIGRIALGSADDVNCAVAAAKRAFPAWSETPKRKRLELLQTLLDLYVDHEDEMASLISSEMGAPQVLASSAQVGAGRAHLQETIRVLEDFPFEYRVSGGDLIIREPIGVSALIAPWNWPMNQVMLKVAPALASGCTLVLKPSELAPFSSMLLADLVDRAGFPPGVFNLVNGDGDGVGSLLSRHPDVEFVSFTGSGRAGAEVLRSSADNMKRVSLELGGKGANIIFDDCDPEAIARGVRHCFRNSGQSCNAPSRMFVHASLYSRAKEVAAEVAQNTIVGPSGNPETQMGPVISEAHWNRVQDLIISGLSQGARLLVGGPGKPDELSDGYFVRPTVFYDVDDAMTIAREEVFGPVLCLMSFETEDEVVARANATAYGLTNYVQSADLEKAGRVARKLRSGMVEINGVSLGEDTPFGGYKASGTGREGSILGLEEFLETKAVSGTTSSA